VVSDITERKNLEEQYRHAQKMEAVGQLAGGVAHEFNNMLTVLIGQSEFIFDMLEEDDPIRADVERIRKISDRAAALTRQLLTFSRKQVTRPEVLDLNDVINNIDKMLRQIISNDIDLVTLLEPELGQINADPGQLEQIIMNLVLNARDAMPHGGTLTVETANVELDELYTRQRVDLEPGKYVMLAISDTGHGIPEEVKSHIFEPFFTTKASDKGTGLGLATVHGIVKQNRGHIWVYSEPEQVTTFKVYLPQVDQTAPSPDEEQSLNTVTQQGTETVLLVEDEDALRDLVRRILMQNGYRVLEARNGSEALQKYGQCTEPIDLLLTDVTMPGGINGPELAKQLRLRRPKFEVIYMSGRTDQVAVHQAELDKSATFLQKPFNLKTLTRKVRKVFDSV
jgi:nitrogen-specific signal transduction histidine kinase/ActR/RegA family two-component response regulator